MRKTTAILGIDIQNDFTKPSGSLFVKGADLDVVRIAAFIDAYGRDIDYIALTLDSHQPIHIANQSYWFDSEGYPPTLFSVISAESVRSKQWMPRFNEKEALPYLEKLEERGLLCTIWPSHCTRGSSGWAINDMLVNVLHTWSIGYNRTFELFCKGESQITEHYSALRAAVEYDHLKKTKLNCKLLDKLESFDRVILVGEAADFCVANTLSDLLKYSPILVNKLVVLTDCMSWINPENKHAKLIFDTAFDKGVCFMSMDDYSPF